MTSVDLNADVGESYGPYIIGDDRALFPLITSANVAAGFHGGDPSVLRATLRLARTHGVAVGAHPGYPDRAGFGRRAMQLSDGDLEDLVLYQIAAVQGVARAEGIALRHVKPHGALYNTAAGDPRSARAFCRAVAAADRALYVIGPPSSALLEEAAALGLRGIAEGFADRGYHSDGTLLPRDVSGAVIHDAAAIANRVVRMARDGRVAAADGRDVAVAVQTVCVHGDTPGAVPIVAAIRKALALAGVPVAPFGV